MSGIYPSRYNQYLADVYASGPFTLFGRQHELALGANYSQQYGKEYEDFSNDTIDYPAIQDWGRQQPAEPTYPGAYLAADQWDRMYRFYAATHLNITDNLKGVAGFNYLTLKSKGYSYGVDTPRDESAVSPYLGIVGDINQNISVYASYTDIFNPQSEVDSSHHTLAAAHGTSIEGGIKSVWLEGKLYATAAVFKSEQDGLADFAGTFPDGKSYYAGIDTFVRGYEFEVSGRLTDQWWVSGGWTDLSIHDAVGQDIRLYTPRQTFKLSTTYAFPELNNLKLGGALRWQADSSTVDLSTVTQEGYAVLDVMGSVDIVDNLGVTLNIRNITDEKYFNSLRWNQAFMGAPRSVTFSLDYKL
jgi:outer membrane receptor for ferric coprogen and ferric-rhodotorulic acid